MRAMEEEGEKEAMEEDREERWMEKKTCFL